MFGLFSGAWKYRNMYSHLRPGHIVLRRAHGSGGRCYHILGRPDRWPFRPISKRGPDAESEPWQGPDWCLFGQNTGKISDWGPKIDPNIRMLGRCSGSLQATPGRLRRKSCAFFHRYGLTGRRSAQKSKWRKIIQPRWWKNAVLAYIGPRFLPEIGRWCSEGKYKFWYLPGRPVFFRISRFGLAEPIGPNYRWRPGVFWKIQYPKARWEIILWIFQKCHQKYGLWGICQGQVQQGLYRDWVFWQFWDSWSRWFQNFYHRRRQKLRLLAAKWRRADQRQHSARPGGRFVQWSLAKTEAEDFQHGFLGYRFVALVL